MNSDKHFYGNWKKAGDYIRETETATFRQIIRKMVYPETETVIFRKRIPQNIFFGR